MYPQFGFGYSWHFVYACGSCSRVSAAVGLLEPEPQGPLSLSKCLYSRSWHWDCSKSAHALDTNIITTARGLPADQELRDTLLATISQCPPWEKKKQEVPRSLYSQPNSPCCYCLPHGLPLWGPLQSYMRQNSMWKLQIDKEVLYIMGLNSSR